MTLSVRSRILLLVLSVLVPAMAGALWLASQADLAERQALDRHLRDTSRALATVIEGAALQRPAEWQPLIARQGLPADWVVQAISPRGQVVALQPADLDDALPGLSPEVMLARAPGREAAFDVAAADGRAMSAYLATTAQGWTLISARPNPARTAALSPAVQKVAVGSLLLLSLAVFGAWWVARRIATPMHALAHAAADAPPGERLAQESVGTSVGISDCDEVAALATQAAIRFRSPHSALEFETSAEAPRVEDAEQRISRIQHIEALGRLTGGVAHDFNNLLGVISNCAHLMQRPASAADLQVPLAAILRSVAVGSRLTQQLLRFAAQQPSNVQRVDLAHTLPELRPLIQAVLGARIAVSVAVAPDTPRVNVDTNEFELALTNLTLNARDAMPLGGHLRLQARRAHDDEVPDLPDGEYVLITISDDGTGIDEHATWHAFEPFFTTKQVGQGTGLSLAQVMGFCVQAGGTARLTSTKGLGTTVSLVLPAHNEAALYFTPTTPHSLTHSIDGMRLLLVEDNDDLAEVTVELLSRLGCKVRRAIDSQVALRMIADEAAFDVVLSDIRMPGGMDGLGLARVLRDYCPDLPVVLLSGYAAQTLPDEDFVVLTKPCPPNTLVTALHDAIEGVAAHR